MEKDIPVGGCVSYEFSRRAARLITEDLQHYLIHTVWLTYEARANWAATCVSMECLQVYAEHLVDESSCDVLSRKTFAG